MRRNAVLAVVLLLVLVFAAGCAPKAVYLPGPGGSEAPAGFFKGLWHGFILLFTFVISLFRDDVGVYESFNTGHMYDLGFVLGVIIFFGGGGGGACKKGR